LGIHNFAQVLSSPAIGPDGTIYFGGGGGDNKLYALSANGTQEWAFQAGSQIAAGPAIGRDGTIYAAVSTTLSTPSIRRQEEMGFVAGKEINTTPASDSMAPFISGVGITASMPSPPMGPGNGVRTGFFINSSPAVAADGTIYFGSEDGFFTRSIRTGLRSELFHSRGH